MIKFENWKSGRVIIQRDKGKIVTWRKVKGSGIKTKADALEIFNTTGSFRRDVIRLKQKTIKTKLKVFSKTKIGYNTYVVRTNKPIKSEHHYQYITLIYWGKERHKTIGYSNLRGTREQSIQRAVQQAIRDRIISYEWRVDIKNRIATPPNPKEKAIRFELTQEVGTYVKAKGKWK